MASGTDHVRVWSHLRLPERPSGNRTDTFSRTCEGLRQAEVTEYSIKGLQHSW